MKHVPKFVHAEMKVYDPNGKILALSNRYNIPRDQTDYHLSKMLERMKLEVFTVLCMHSAGSIYIDFFTSDLADERGSCGVY